MLFKVESVERGSRDPVELKTLKQFVDWCKQWQPHSVIVDVDRMELLIYDDYIE